MKNNLDRAKRRVKKKKGFYVHLGVFLSVGLFFLLINLLTDPRELWFFFPMLPWGVGLAIHYLTVFGLPGTDILTKEWEDREMQKELWRLRRERGDRATTPPGANADDGEALDLDRPPRQRVPRFDEPDEEEFV